MQRVNASSDVDEIDCARICGNTSSGHPMHLPIDIQCTYAYRCDLLCGWTGEHRGTVQNDRMLRPALEQVAASSWNDMQTTTRWRHRVRWKIVSLPYFLPPPSFLLLILSTNILLLIYLQIYCFFYIYKYIPPSFFFTPFCFFFSISSWYMQLCFLSASLSFSEQSWLVEWEHLELEIFYLIYT